MSPRIGPKHLPHVYFAEWRNHYGFSQEKLGARFDPPIAKGQVSKIEKNRRPTIAVVAAFAEALDPTLDWRALTRVPPEDSASDDLAAVAGRLEEAAQALRKRAR